MDFLNFITFGSLLFWAVLAVLFIIEIIVAYSDKTYGVGIIMFLLPFLFLELFVKEVNIFTWVSNNYWVFIGYVGFYLLIGFTWSSLKLYVYVKRHKDSFFKRYEYNETKEKNSAVKEEDFYYTKCPRNEKEKIANWFILWPFSFLIWAINDPVRWIIELFSGYYDWVMRQALGIKVKKS